MHYMYNHRDDNETVGQQYVMSGFACSNPDEQGCKRVYLKLKYDNYINTHGHLLNILENSGQLDMRFDPVKSYN